MLFEHYDIHSRTRQQKTQHHYQRVLHLQCSNGSLLFGKWDGLTVSSNSLEPVMNLTRISPL